MKLLLAIAYVIISCSFVKESVSQEIDKGLECPFPEGQDVESESECARYTACIWQDGDCVMRNSWDAGYMVSEGIIFTDRGYMFYLEKANPNSTLFGQDVRQPVIEIIGHESYHVQIKIYDRFSDRYKVPVPLSLPKQSADDTDFAVTMSTVGEPLRFAVERRDGEGLFSTVGPIIFEDQFIQLTTTLPSTYMYGMGENVHSTFRHVFEPRQTQPIYARDHGITNYTGNLYGHHPYYVVVNNDTGLAHSVLFFNSNAQEYSTFLLENGEPALTLRSIGGIIDLHFFLGPSLEEVNQQYYKMIGYPMLPPYWSLGFHLSRWGYNGTDDVRALRKRIKAAGIPQDGQMIDGDYMDDWKDFTYNQDAFGDLPDLLQELHDEDIKVTLLLDPGVSSDWTNYPPGKRGKDADAFVKWYSSEFVPGDQDPSLSDYVVGKVWPEDPCVFPDFSNPDTQHWWSDELRIFHETISYDALWLDMNEPANFDTNLDEVGDESFLFEENLQCPNNTMDSPPYPTVTVRIDNPSGRLSDHTLCLSSSQTDGEKNYTHYDIHSLYGYLSALATNRGLDAVFPGKRKFLLTRSTFPASGQYSIHWLGDNEALWSHMKMSIIGMLEFNLFGIPMVGADICGFWNEPSMELCARWTQLGAFYPFSRNHNAIGMSDQDPAVWPEVAAIAKDVLTLRYQYLPYLYALFHNSYMNGDSVARPLFSQFPLDERALDVDDQFFWGEGIMVAPVVSEGSTERDVYFPNGVWYDLKTGARVATGPTELTVEAPLDVIPVYAYGGVALPNQEPGLSTSESRQNPFGLTIPLDSSLEAMGEIFWDDGESEHVMEETYLASVIYTKNTLAVKPLYSSDPVKGLNLETLRFFGYPADPKGIEVNGNALPSSQWNFNATSNVLEVEMSAPLGDPINVTLT